MFGKTRGAEKGLTGIPGGKRGKRRKKSIRREKANEDGKEGETKKGLGMG